MTVEKRPIDGLLLFHLDIHPDGRGSFCEIMQIEKMMKLGLPRFNTVQSNVSVSDYGSIRGIHAEPWSKLITPILGTIFSAIVDLREDSPTYGQVEIFPELDRRHALFVPQGCGNSFAVTSEQVLYHYNVNAHWYESEPYLSVAYDDPTLNIPWPIPMGKRIVSDKDLRNPPFNPRP